MVPFLVLMLLAIAELANAANSVAKSIFILAGQSNMSGRGGVTNSKSSFIDAFNSTWDSVIPPECQPNPSILRLSAGLTWVEAQVPLHKDIDVTKTCGIGPGMPFANELLKRYPHIGVIGLVPCAIGGTNISEWARGSLFYHQMIRRTKAALRGGGRIRALLWYQGESDTNTLEDAKLYKLRLKRFFTHVRYDLHLPTLPVIQVALATGEGSYMELIRKAQLGINLPIVKCVDAKGLSVGPDFLHLTTPAQIHLGHMLADAFLHSNMVL